MRIQAPWFRLTCLTYLNPHATPLPCWISSTRSKSVLTSLGEGSWSPLPNGWWISFRGSSPIHCRSILINRAPRVHCFLTCYLHLYMTPSDRQDRKSVV